MYISQDMFEQLTKIASTCEQAIYETEMAIGDNNKGYPYASGYSRSALKNVLDDVNVLLKSYDSNTNH
jgi:hypothetical protein